MIIFLRVITSKINYHKILIFFDISDITEYL